MIARSPVTPARIAANVPCPPSSSDGTNATTSSPSSLSRSPAAASTLTAARMAATPPFMSHAPRPYRASLRISPPHGSPAPVAGSPGGTTSKWPDRMIRRPPARPIRPTTMGRVVRAISSPGQSGPARMVAGSGLIVSTTRPRSPSASAAHDATASSEPVTLGSRTRAVRSATSLSRSIARSATQDRPRHAGGTAGAVEPDLGRGIRMDLAARRGERRPGPGIAFGKDDHARPNRQDVAPERWEFVVGDLDHADVKIDEQLPQADREQRHVHDGKVVGDRRDHRHEMDELTRATPVRHVEHANIATDESG